MDKLIIFIFAIIGINFLVGVVKSIGKDFDIQLFWQGLGSVIKKEIALALLVYGYWYLTDVQVLEIAYAPIFYFIAGLSTVYHTNSALINVCHLLELDDVAVLQDLDDLLKNLKGKRFFQDEPREEIEGVG
jgi:hypothetical protein